MTYFVVVFVFVCCNDEEGVEREVRGPSFTETALPPHSSMFLFLNEK